MARDSRDVTRARIRDAARRLFLTRGFTRVSIEDVAAKAGYTRGAVYSNFANKGELFFALVDERFDDQLARPGFAAPETATPAQRVNMLARWLATEASQTREWLSAEIEFTAFASTDPALSIRMMEAQRAGRAALADLLAAECRLIGVTPALAPDDLAAVVTSLIRGLTIEYLVDLQTDVAGLLAAALRQLLGVPNDAEADADADADADEARGLPR